MGTLWAIVARVEPGLAMSRSTSRPALRSVSSTGLTQRSDQSHRLGLTQRLLLGASAASPPHDPPTEDDHPDDRKDDQERKDDRDHGEAEAGDILDRARDRGADARRRRVDDRPRAGLYRMYDERDDRARDHWDPLVTGEVLARVLHGDGLRGGGRAERKAAGGGPDERLYDVVDVVDQRNFVGHHLDREQYHENGDYPAILEPLPRPGQGDQ